MSYVLLRIFFQIDNTILSHLENIASHQYHVYTLHTSTCHQPFNMYLLSPTMLKTKIFST